MRTKKKGKNTTGKTGNSKFSGIDPNDPKLRPQWDNYETYEQLIESLKLDAKWKGLLKDILRLVIKVGKRVIEVGKKIVEVILFGIKKYPKTAATLLVGSILAFIMGHIPVLGQILAPLLGVMTITIASIVFLSEAVESHIVDSLSPFRSAKV